MSEQRPTGTECALAFLVLMAMIVALYMRGTRLDSRVEYLEDTLWIFAPHTYGEFPRR